MAAHRTALQARGINGKRVIMKGCPALATTIQSKGAASAEAEELLAKFIAEAWSVMAARMAEGGTAESVAETGLGPGLGPGLGRVSAVFAGLCCTHYGYSLPLWNKHLGKNAALAALVCESFECLNPNRDMCSDSRFQSGDFGLFRSNRRFQSGDYPS